MRTISAAAVTDAVAKLCIQANTHLPPDIVSALDRTRREEPWPLAKETLGLLWDNLELAEREELPVCQDTGMACVFVELGQEVHIQGDFEQAIHAGVQRGYGEGYLRKSIVADPLRRVNTGDNTPAHHPAAGAGEQMHHHRGSQGLRLGEHEPPGDAQAR